jgi:hypothetical protein
MPNAFASGCVEVSSSGMCVAVFVVLGGEDACLNSVGKGWLDVPIWVSVLGVYVEKFVYKSMIISMET